MKAKDTVMSDEQLDNIGYPILPIGDRTGSRRVAQAQAEISFKAGERKVVDFVKRVVFSEPSAMSFNCRERWQAFLKSEGIE